MSPLVELALLPGHAWHDTPDNVDRFVAIETGFHRLGVVTSRSTTAIDATLYRPVICLILQGVKEVELGTERTTCAPGQCIVVSHDLPIRSQITSASPESPYVALTLELDIELLQRLVDDLDDLDVRPTDGTSTALVIGSADAAMVDAFRRLLELQHTPTQAPVLAPLIVRELHYRLLIAENGTILRRLLSQESHASRIATAIAQIRRSLDTSLSVSNLAESVGMSPSSFHQHFRAITATTPLRYQKDLRLLEARHLLFAGDRTVTEVALAVGYRSPTQFSREYSRKFGVPPSLDRRRRTHGTSNTLLAI